VAQGDSILWTNNSTIVHDSTQGTASTPTASRLWVSPNLSLLSRTYRFTVTNMGTYPYLCLQHAITQPQQTGTVTVVRGNFEPAVNITSPAPTSRHPAPPNFAVVANATDSDGSVTSVTFTATPTGGAAVDLGTDTVAPFSVLFTNLPAATYALRAIAVDNEGLSSTSAPISVLVATPVPLVLRPLGTPSGGQFKIAYPTTQGMSYVLEESGDLSGAWLPVLTNVGPGGVGASITNTRPFNAAAPTQRFYRALILP
jgi:hypothetical protein